MGPFISVTDSPFLAIPSTTGTSPDCLAAFSDALAAAYAAGIALVFAPKPPAGYTYYLSGTPVEQPGVSLVYNPPDLRGPGRPAKGIQLAALEGGTQDNYRHALATFLQVPTSQATAQRYWTLYGAVDVPPGTTFPSGTTGDCVGTRGQSRSRSAGSRHWGVVGVAQTDLDGASQSEVGDAYGGEFDINNNTGFDCVLPGTAGAAVPEVAAAMFATGGSNFALAARMTSANTGSQFLTGDYFRAGCLSHSAAYHDQVGPSHGFYYFSNFIIGNPPALSTKNEQVVWLGRGAGQLNDTSHVGKLKTTASATAWAVGPGTGAGSLGTYWANNADTVVRMGLSDSGVLSVTNFAATVTSVSSTGPLIGLAVTSGNLRLTGSGLGELRNLAAGEFDGQQITVLNRSGGTIQVTNGNSTGGIQMILEGLVTWTTMTNLSTLSLLWDGAGGVWIETGRCQK